MSLHLKMHKLFFFFSVKPENVHLVATNIGDKACQDDYVSLSCSADASPPVSSYQFFENGVLLGSNNSGMLATSLSSTGRLIYRCVAGNLVGAANSANVSIYVGGTVTCTYESLRPPPPFLLEGWIFSVLNRKRKMEENHARTYRFRIVLPSICSRNQRFLAHSGENCVVSIVPFLHFDKKDYSV